MDLKATPQKGKTYHQLLSRTLYVNMRPDSGGISGENLGSPPRDAVLSRCASRLYKGAEIKVSHHDIQCFEPRGKCSAAQALTSVGN